MELVTVVKKFGGLRAVDGVSLSVEKGEIVGLIGPNGSGKTTLFNVIAGVYKPDEGRVLLEGHDITDRAPDEVFQKGVVRSFQVPRLFTGMTALENLLVPPPSQKGEKMRFAPFHGIWNSQESILATDARKLSETLELFKVITNPSGDISGGQMKLLEIGRAMMGKPKMLLLDEPTAGIFPKLALEIFERITKIRKEHDITFFIIEHRLDMLFKYVDRLFVMHHGKIIAEGCADEIYNDPTVKRVYLGL